MSACRTISPSKKSLPGGVVRIWASVALEKPTSAAVNARAERMVDFIGRFPGKLNNRTTYNHTWIDRGPKGGQPVLYTEGSASEPGGEEVPSVPDPFPPPCLTRFPKTQSLLGLSGRADDS